MCLDLDRQGKVHIFVNTIFNEIRMIDAVKGQYGILWYEDSYIKLCVKNSTKMWNSTVQSTLINYSKAQKSSDHRYSEQIQTFIQNHSLNHSFSKIHTCFNVVVVVFFFVQKSLFG